MSDARRPLPEPSDLTRPFWEAAGRHELVVQRCRTCRQHQFYPRPVCAACGGSELEWARVSGRGTVHSFTVMRRPADPAFADRVPFVIALVDLEEGPRMTTNIVGCAPEDVGIGLPVEVEFEDLRDGIALPVFRPAVA